MPVNGPTGAGGGQDLGRGPKPIPRRAWSGPVGAGRVGLTGGTRAPEVQSGRVGPGTLFSPGPLGRRGQTHGSALAWPTALVRVPTGRDRRAMRRAQDTEGPVPNV